VAEEIENRLATLEVQNKIQTRDIAKLEAAIEHKVGAMQRDIADIKDGIARQRGFWAGVTFFASVIGFVLAQLWGHIKGIGS